MYICVYYTYWPINSFYLPFFRVNSSTISHSSPNERREKNYSSTRISFRPKLRTCSGPRHTKDQSIVVIMKRFGTVYKRLLLLGLRESNIKEAAAAAAAVCDAHADVVIKNDRRRWRAYNILHFI